MAAERTAPATTLPARWYHDPDIYERERVTIFGREWLYFAREDQLRDAGQYVAADLSGWSVLVLRHDDGGLRGFHNVCRHRAGPLLEDGEGRCSSLVCRYHGWSYDTDGRLVAARDFGGDASGRDGGPIALVPIRVEAWRGLVFVNLDVDATPLHQSLGGFAEECAAFPIEEMAFHSEVAHHLDVNWKTYADNYMEGYHIPLVHRELNRLIDAKRYRVDVADRFCRHHAPARDGSPTTGVWLWRFPNLALNIYPSGMNVERFLPIGPRKTLVVYTYFFTGPADEESLRLSAELLREDEAICNAVQRNLESGIYDRGQLSPRHENGVAYFQSLVRDAVGTTASQ